MKTIKAYYVDTKNNTASAVDITPDLHTYYEMLDCHTIDIVNRGFGRSGKKRFDIICDDEGLFVDDPILSAVDGNGRAMLVGSLLVVGEADEEGEETSLTDEDVRLLERYTGSLFLRGKRTPRVMLYGMTY